VVNCLSFQRTLLLFFLSINTPRSRVTISVTSCIGWVVFSFTWLTFLLLPKFSTDFRFSLFSLSTRDWIHNYSAFAEGLFPLIVFLSSEEQSLSIRKQVRNQKVFKFESASLQFLVRSAYSEEPRWFPCLFVCSPHSLLPSRVSVTCGYLIWLIHHWS